MYFFVFIIYRKSKHYYDPETYDTVYSFQDDARLLNIVARAVKIVCYIISMLALNGFIERIIAFVFFSVYCIHLLTRPYIERNQSINCVLNC